MPEQVDDDFKYCQGPECNERKKTVAVKICHHTECQEGNNMNPLLLCDDCDQFIHVGQAVCHLRFQLPKNFKRTASMRSTNSDSGNEEETETKHFDKKNRGYASARRFFNMNSTASSSSRKKSSRCKLPEDKGHEMLRIQFYKRGSETEIETEVVPAIKGRSLKDALAPLYEKRGLSFETHSVFLDASHTPLPLAFDIYPLGGNDLHVRAIDDIKVDKRIIEIAKQALTKEKEKERDENERKNASKRDQSIRSNQSHRGKKNLSSYLGESDFKMQSPGLNGQRRLGAFSGPNLRDVTRSFGDILDYYRINGIVDDKDENEDGVDFDDEDFFMEESWTIVVEFSPDLSKKGKDQQEAIWELLTTEANYLRKLRLLIKLFLRGLRSLQREGHLQEIDIKSLFGNITDIWKANFLLWTQFLKPVVEQARKDKKIILPSALFDAFSRFGEVCHPYIEYCMEEDRCLRYLKENIKENEKFKLYLTWCENHDICHRLKLTDLLVKPMQRLTKYPLLLRAIFKKTLDQEEKNSVSEMMTNVERFLNQVDSSLRIRQEQKRMQNVVDRLDLYMPVEPVNDEVEKILGDYFSLDLNCKVPFLSAVEHRCVLMEGALKLAEKQNRTDVYCFLFSDIFLITKAKRSNEKFKIIKQPFRLNKIVIHQLKESGGFLFIYRNEYGSLINAFILQAPASDQTKWIQNIDKAKRRYNNARAGQGSTYEFFDDDITSPIAHASPHHSPNQERRPSWQQYPKYSFAPSFEPQPPIIVTDQLADIRKPRSYSIEPRRVTSPHIEVTKLSESFDSSGKVMRSVSEPKSDKNEVLEKKKSSKSRNSAAFWQSSRPASMIVQSKGIDDFTATFMMQEKRSRSGSFGLDSPAEESEARRNESFRSTSSDTVLIRSEFLRRGSQRSIKSSASAPEVSQMALDQRYNRRDDSSLSCYSGPTHETVSVSSSDTSVSTEIGALSRDNSFNKSRRNEMSVLDEKSQDELTDCLTTPDFFLDLDDNTDLKESLVDDANDVQNHSKRILVDQESQTEVESQQQINRQSQTTIDTESQISQESQTYTNELLTSSSKNQESQTDFAMESVNHLRESPSVDDHSQIQETGVQCDLIQRLSDCSDNHQQHTAINFQRATSLADSPNMDARRNSDTGLLRAIFSPRGLRSCQSEIDLRTSMENCKGLHYRSLSDDGKTNFNFNNNISPKRAGPGMQALQSLSRSLENSCQPQPKKAPKKDGGDGKLTVVRSASPVTLHKVALLNSSPVVSRKNREISKSSPKNERASKSPSKRATWHADSLSVIEKLEKELYAGSKDDFSMPNNNEIASEKDGEKPKRPERKKSRAKKKEEKKKKKKEAEMQAGVFSGPNIDKRKAQRLFLENSLMHEKPEIV